jgi:hypothetical protein
MEGFDNSAWLVSLLAIISSSLPQRIPPAMDSYSSDQGYPLF